MNNLREMTGATNLNEVTDTEPSSLRRRDIASLLRKLLSFPVFLGAVLAAGALAVTTSGGVVGGKVFASGDIWWLAAVGKQILSTSSWPTHDTYSFTVNGHPWVVYQWLGAVAMELAIRVGGLQGLAGLLIAWTITLILLLFVYAWVGSGNVKAAAVATTFMLPLLGSLLSLRSQLLGYIFLLVVLICLEQARRGRLKALWVLPPVFLLWVNTHGSFVLGLLALATYGVCGLVSFRFRAVEARRWTPQERRRLEVIALLSVLALLVTPYGTRLAAAPVDLGFVRWLEARVVEWRAPDLFTPAGYLFLALLLLLVLALAFSWTTFRLEELVLIAFGAYESFHHERMLMFFAIVATGVVARTLARWLPPYEPTKDHPLWNAALITAIVGGMLWFFPREGSLQSVLRRTYPEGAVAYLRNHDVGPHLYNDDAWGSYLIWSLFPQRRVFFDGRFDLYDDSGVFDDFLRVDQVTPATDLVLWKYKIDACLIHRGQVLERYLERQPDWKRAYEDEVSTIFVRAKTATGPSER